MSWILRLTVDVTHVDARTEQLWDLGTSGVAQVEENNSITLLAGFEDLADARRAAEQVGGDVEAVDSSVWEISDDVVVEVGQRRSEIRLEVGTAFGHGSHPTTRLVLDELESIAAVAPLGSLLDVGTGTGVLALAGAVLGATPIVGVDLDEPSIAIARRNAERNSSLFPQSTIDLSTAALDQLDGVFDTVVANLLLADFRPIAHLVSARVRQRLIVSGFLEDQVAEMHALVPDLRLSDHRHDGGWVMLRFEA